MMPSERTIDPFTILCVAGFVTPSQGRAVVVVVQSHPKGDVTAAHTHFGFDTIPLMAIPPLVWYRSQYVYGHIHPLVCAWRTRSVKDIIVVASERASERATKQTQLKGFTLN